MDNKNKNGFLLVVWGHSYYGRYAFNLAVSIKSVEFDAQVAIVYKGSVLSHLNEEQRMIFDHIIEMPDDIIPNYGIKLQLNKLTPFKNTIFLDCDMAWLSKHKPSDLFSELEPFEFSSITEGHFDIETKVDSGNPKYYYWADVNEIISVYKPKANIYQWRSEVIYFKSTKNIDKFFDLAQKIYVNPKLKSIKRFAHIIPDELAINVAAAVCGIHPHKEKWQPSYWPVMNNNFIPDFVALNAYYLLSCGSNVMSPGVKTLYNNVISEACRKLDFQHIFTPHNKRQFDQQRLKM